VVDGQQRLLAIWEFMGGELKLNAEQTAKFGAADYEALSEELSDAFDDYEIEYDEITNASDEDIKEFFQRLQEGLPLTSSEKLNSVHSKLRDYCVRAASNDFFSKTIVISDKRYAHFDILAKVATIEIEGLDASLRFEDIKRVFKSNGTFSAQSAAAKRINNTLKYLSEVFPEKYSPFRNRTVVQSVISFVCHLQQAGVKLDKQPVVREFIESFLAELRKQVELGQDATDQDFMTFQSTINANVKSGARTRQSIILRQLFRKHPSFFSVVGSSANIIEGIELERDSLAKKVRQLITSINDRYAGQHGCDLFKPTNKTTSALMALGAPVQSLDDYKKFIEELYFVFRESVGQRLVDRLPISFEHINALRTMLQHDVDHGEASKVSKKRKDLAAVFQLYSGSPSPDAVDPSAFCLVQINILTAVKNDLSNLAKSLS